MSEKNLRDHGLGPSGEPVGTPTWEKAEVKNGIEPVCPNCSGWLCEVRVEVAHPLLKSRRGVSMYLGCPACPYASPAVVVAGSEA